MLTGIIVPKEGICGINTINSRFPFTECPENWKTDILDLEPWTLNKFDSKDLSFEYFSAQECKSLHPVFVFEKCSSVMDLIPMLNKQGLVRDWGSVISVAQTKGRGRFYRKWESTPGNIHAALQFPGFHEDFSSLASMIVSVIMIEFFRKHGIEAGLKWPNDIIFDGKKIAGILVEKKQSGYIVGIGVNLKDNPALAEMREGFAFPAGTVSLPENAGGPLKIWIDFMNTLVKRTYEIVYSIGLSGFISIASGMLIWKGELVRVSDIPEGEIYGEIFGIGATGGLRVGESCREKEIFSGTVVRVNNS